MYVWIALKTADVCICVFLCGFRALFTGLASTNFNKFFFKIESYDTIYTFKNYFVIVFLILSNKQTTKM